MVSNSSILAHVWFISQFHFLYKKDLDPIIKKVAFFVEHHIPLNCRLPRSSFYLPKAKGGLGLLHAMSQVEALWTHTWHRAISNPNANSSKLLLLATSRHVKGPTFALPRKMKNLWKKYGQIDLSTIPVDEISEDLFSVKSFYQRIVQTKFGGVYIPTYSNVQDAPTWTLNWGIVHDFSKRILSPLERQFLHKRLSFKLWSSFRRGEDPFVLFATLPNLPHYILSLQNVPTHSCFLVP